MTKPVVAVLKTLAVASALAMPGTTPAEMAAKTAAIATARGYLSTISNKEVTTDVVSRVDSLLGLPATP
jgi:hypothetical protein